jgi:hypothetical protein
MTHRHGRHNGASTDGLKRNINDVKSMTCKNREREVSSRTVVSGASESQARTLRITAGLLEVNILFPVGI